MLRRFHIPIAALVAVALFALVSIQGLAARCNMAGTLESHACCEHPEGLALAASAGCPEMSPAAPAIDDAELTSGSAHELPAAPLVAVADVSVRPLVTVEPLIGAPPAFGSAPSLSIRYAVFRI